MKILDLIVKGKWYDMIDSGEKPEEYRDIKPYWCARIIPPDYLCEHLYTIPPTNYMYLCGLCGMRCGRKDEKQYISYTHVRFHRGYTNITMTFAIKEITIGMGNPQWGAPTDREVFIIKLGERI